MVRVLLCLGLLLSVAFGEGLEPGEKDRSPRAAHMREHALAVWERAEAVVQALERSQSPTPEQAVATTKTLEEAVVLLEKALRVEWHAETNATLARAVAAWYGLRPYLPGTSSAEAGKADAREKEKHRRARVRDVRRLILDYGRARRFDQQYRTCHRCDGRGELYDAFNKGKRPCPVCHREGRLPIREGIIHARWHFLSPLYRAQPRSATDVERALDSAARAPQRLGPFVRSVAISSIEDHDLWARVEVVEKTFLEPGSQKTVKTPKTYLLYRVGKSWYLYFPRTDRKLIEIPAD